MVELSDYVPVDLICLGLLAALGLRRVVLMEGFHRLRVVLLTGLLWLPVIYFFLSIFAGMLPPPCDHYHCVPTDEGPGVYTITET